MTSTADLLGRLQALDIRLALDGEHLAVNAPKGAITPALRDELGRRKEEVKTFLKASGIAAAPSRKEAAPPLQRIARAAEMPVSHTQQRLWFIKQMDPASHAYNIPAGLRLKGGLDQVVLRRTLNELLERHESLRTRFVSVDGLPRCVIDPRAEVALEQIDLSPLPLAEREAAAQHAVHQVEQRPFDIARAPLLHTALVRLAFDEHLLVFVFDHIVADGLSVGIFLHEFQALYSRHAGGAVAELPELPVQYLDYAEWERRWFATGSIDAHLAFWKQQLAALPPLLQLPADRPRPPVQTDRGARAVLQLPVALGQQLKALARAEGATHFMVLMSAFQALLHRHSGETDIAVGTAIANRSRSEVERVIGFFANNIVLRGDLSGEPTVRELIARVRDTALKAYAHQDMPFDMLVDALATRRELGHSPLFQVMFVLQNIKLAGFELPGLVCETMESTVRTARFDLAVDVFDLAQGLRIYFEYNTDLFDASTIERMKGHYSRLLEGFVARPDTRVGELPMLGDDEQQALLVWNRGAAAVPNARTVHGLFEAQVESTPDALALRFEDVHFSYRELNARANRLAHHLRTLGVGPESMVGVWIERCADMVVALLAVLKAGGAYVPLDPAFPQDRIRFMMADAGLAVVLTQASLAQTLKPDGPRAVCLDGDTSWLAQLSAGNPPPLAEAANLAYVIYTSGSTGRPKGVMLEHRSVVNFLLSMHREPGLTAADRFVSVTTLSFDIAGLEIHGPLTAGGTVVLTPRATALDGARLAELLDQSEATVLQATPATWQLLLASGWRGRPGLKMLCGGEALPRELAGKLLSLPGELWNLYGPTETTIWSTVWRVTDASRTIPIGRPIANTQVHVLEPSGLPAPIGVSGELVIGGAGLARGYLHRDELSAQMFVTLDLPGVGRARVYRTGDVARFLADGRLEYVGRRDQQVKLRGFRIELGEIETVLARHPGLKACVVHVREDTPGDQRLVAYVVASAGTPFDADAARATLRTQLPEYMVPNLIVALDTLPLTPNGKVDRKALPAPVAPSSKDNVVAPRTPVEQAIWEIWRDVLRLRDFGVHDNFFELGGHSLLATQVMARMREVLRVDLPLRALFEAPDVAGLAAAAERKRAAESETPFAERPAITRVERAGLLPTSYSQRRMWLVQQFNPGTTAYNMPFALRLRGGLDRERLVESLQRLVARHEAFRTTLVAVDGEPMQRIVPFEPVTVEMLDLRSLPEAERDAAAAQALHQRSTLPYDLAEGPLHRPTLLQLGEQDHVLFWSIHHAIGDGWSSAVLLHEFSTIYSALMRGQQPSLAPLAIDFADYASWQRSALSTALLAAQVAFWKQALAGLQPLPLPLDRPRRGVQDGRGASVSASFKPQTVAALKALTVRHAVTPYMALLACFQLLLARHCDATDVAVGTPIANRTHLSSEQLVGTLVNTLVMRTDLAGDPSFAELLKRVRETALQAYAHQDLPFEALVEALAVPRADGAAPLVQVLFNVLNPPHGDKRIEGIVYEPFVFDVGSSQFDLVLTIDTEVFGQAHLSLSTDVFEPATGRRLLAHFMGLVDQVLADPQRPISSYDMVGAEDRQLLASWNHTPPLAPPAAVAHELLNQQARRTPECIALRSGAVSVSYAELQSRALRLCRALRLRGVGRGGLVGLCLPRTADMVVAQWAILQSGAAYVPLDPAYPPDRLSYMALDAKLSLLVSEDELAAGLDWPAEKSLLLDRDAAFIAQQPTTVPEPDAALDARPEDPAYVIYTSGSTGRPKGVVVPHRGVVNFLASMAREPGLSASDVLVAVTTLSFDIAVLELLLPLSVGAQVVLASRDEATDGQTLRALLDATGATVMQATPSSWRLLIEAGWQASQQPGTGGFKALIGGEGLPPDLAQQLLQRIGAAGELWNLYGPTETTVWSTCWKVNAHQPGIRIGRPIANTQVHILDAHGQPCPIGVSGEIFIAGSGVALGYLERPELTAERFVADPFSVHPGARMYRTGDRGRWCHDGLLEHLGRLDFQVKVRGHRIELGEIEATLAAHPAVKQTVVMARESGPGDLRLVAYIVFQPGEDLTVSDVRRHLRRDLPEYMIPSVVAAVDEIPLTANGKINRLALPDPFKNALLANKNFVAPEPGFEQEMADIWRGILQVDRVGAEDNFFELGGHSLLSLRVTAAVEKKLGWRMDARTLYFQDLRQVVATAAANQVSQSP